MTMSTLDATECLSGIYVEEEQVVRKRVCVWAQMSDGAQLNTLFNSACASVVCADHSVGEHDSRAKFLPHWAVVEFHAVRSKSHSTKLGFRRRD